MINFKVYKKLLISFLASIILLVSVMSRFAAPARAQLPDTWYAPEFGSFVDRVYNKDNEEEIFGERYTQAQVVWILHSITAILLPEFILTCMTIDDLGDAGSCVAGIFSAILPIVDNSQQNTSLAATIDSVTTNNPISGVGYLRGLAEKFQLVPEAQAQGFGFSTLEPLQRIWVAVRDIAYFLLIIAFIIMAFMIMFRTKTSPQTVITVQSALPRLVMILILITFSFAIAGFVIDLSYLSLGLLAILGSTLTDLNSLELFNVLVTSLPIYSAFLLPMLVGLVITISGALLTLAPFIGVLGPFIVTIGALFTLLIFLIWLIIVLRIIWLMIKTFINIVLLIAAAPIMILLGVFPTTGGFGTWIRNLASHVFVFPAIIAMVFLNHFIFWSSIDTSSSIGGPVGKFLSSLAVLNPYVVILGSGQGTIELPGFSLGDSTVFGIIVSFGILFLIPSIGGIIQSLISGRPFSYGSAIGQAFAPAGFLYGSGPARAIREPLGRTVGGAITKRGGWVARKLRQPRIAKTFENYSETVSTGGRRKRS